MFDDYRIASHEVARGRCPLNCNLCCCVQHIFNEDSVTHGGIIDQNVGNSSYQLPVLYKGTAAHECVKYRTTLFCEFIINLYSFDCKFDTITPKLIF